MITAFRLTLGLIVFTFCTQAVFSQERQFEPSLEHPFGLPNPKAPEQLMDFAPLIGECECRSYLRVNQNEWNDTTDMIWQFKYIMNGMGVQDETWLPDGKYAGSIRQFIADSGQWYVHYYSSPLATPTLPSWEGSKQENGDIVLYRDQQAPNGMDGKYKITFSNISEDGFDWLGEWVTPDESIHYPTWKIWCQKKKSGDHEAQKAELIAVGKSFSKAFIAKDFDAMANAYTSDAKIFPLGIDFVSGKSQIRDYWANNSKVKLLEHYMNPESVKFLGDYAYDYGYYGGKFETDEGENRTFKGKYVLVWKKEDENWRIHLDIWNGMNVED